MTLHERLRKAAELLDSADVQIHSAFNDTRGYMFCKVLHLIEAVSIAKFLVDEAAKDAVQYEEETTK